MKTKAILNELETRNSSWYLIERRTVKDISRYIRDVFKCSFYVSVQVAKKLNENR